MTRGAERFLAVFLAAFGLAAGLGLVKSGNVPHSVTAGTNPVYTFYTVTDPAQFQALKLPLPPKSEVYWGGLLIYPGIDYTVQTGSIDTFSVRSPIEPGDKIVVVTFQ